MAGLPLIGVEYIAKNLGKYKSDLEAGNKATAGANKELSNTSKVAAGAEKALTRLSTVGALAIGGLAVAGIKMSVDFDKAFRNVQTLFPGAEASIAGMKDQVLDLSKSLGIDAVGATEALYDALSASVPPENAMAFLETASKAAIGGSIATKDAVNVLTSTMNAFGIESSKAEQVSDILFTTVAKGKTTMGELSRAMFNVAPAAAAAGLSLEETAAAIASITKQGVPTTVATTQLRQAIVELQKPGKDLKPVLQAIGFESGQAALKSLGLQGTLEALAAEAGRSGKNLTQVFSSVEAGGAALALTGKNFATAEADLAAMGDAAGTTAAAFNTMNESSARQFEIAKNRLKGSAISMTQDLLPAINSAVGGLATLTQKFSELDPEQQKLIAGVGSMMIILPKLASMFGANALKAGALGIAIGGIAIASDILLRKTTGAGLIDNLLGNAGDIRRTAESVERISIALRAAGAESNTIEVLAGELKKVRDEFDALSKSDFNEQFGVGGNFRFADAMKQAKKDVEELGKAMVDAGASTALLAVTSAQLPPELRVVFDEATKLKDVLAAAGTDSLAGAAEAASLDLQMANKAAGELADGLEEMPPILSAGQQAIADWGASLVDAEGDVIKVDDAIKALNETLTVAQPIYLLAKANTALLKEELSDLKAKGDAVTASEKERIRVIEDELIPAQEAITKAVDDDSDALKALDETIGRLIGPAVYGALRDEMTKTNRTADEQVDIIGEVTGVWDDLAAGTIPSAIEKIDALKATLNPTEWAILAEAIGPAFMASLQSGLADPMKHADLVALMEQLGIDITSGVGRGMINANATAQISAAISQLKGQITTEMAGAFQTYSPSKLMEQEVGLPLSQGIAIGITKGTPYILSAIDEQAAQMAARYAEQSRAQRNARVAYEVATAQAVAEAARAAANAASAADPLAGDPYAGSPFTPEQIADFENKYKTASGVIGTVDIKGSSVELRTNPISGLLEYNTGPGRWTTFTAADAFDRSGNRIVGGNLQNWGFEPLAQGTPFVPFDTPAFLHRGEAVVPAAYNPFGFAQGPGRSPSGPTNIWQIEADFSGAQFTGSPAENEEMMRRVFSELTDEQNGRDAFLHGVAVRM